MKIFVVTDNYWWLKKATELFMRFGYDATFYCSPKGAHLFSREVENGEVKIIDLNQQYKELLAKFDMGFSIHCKQIFPAELVSRLRCVNVHPGLNPYNRGWFPQVFSIMNKKPAGATIHIMDELIDHGGVLFQREVEVEDWDTSKTLYDRVVEAEYALLANNLELIVTPNNSVTKIGVEGNYNSISDFNALKEIDMDREITMREAIDYLRALTHPPYSNAFFRTEVGEKIFVTIKLDKQN